MPAGHRVAFYIFIGRVGEVVQVDAGSQLPPGVAHARIGRQEGGEPIFGEGCLGGVALRVG